MDQFGRSRMSAIELLSKESAECAEHAERNVLAQSYNMIMSNFSNIITVGGFVYSFVLFLKGYLP